MDILSMKTIKAAVDSGVLRPEETELAYSIVRDHGHSTLEYFLVYREQATQDRIQEKMNQTLGIDPATFAKYGG